MWPYYVLMFVSSACMMTLELVAGRLVAPYLGTSLYSWTSVIGVVLSGMSGGYFFGGWLADRREPRRLLTIILALSGLTTLSILPLISPVMNLVSGSISVPMLQVFLSVLLVFGIPSFCLGLVSPIIYKVCITDLGKTGRTVGRLAACGSAGSIAGTFATGFWLIPAFGTRAIVAGVALVCIGLGFAYAPWAARRRRATEAALAAAFLVSWYATPQLWASEWDVESAYYAIRISWTEHPQAGPIKQLVLDHLVHSGMSPKDPDFLWYEYEQMGAWLFENQALARRGDAGRKLSALFIGGGGYILPHWVERHFPQAVVEVIEIDPAVTEIALREFISPDTRIKTYNEDGRAALKALPADAKYDFIFADAFNDVSIPFHLTTYEFAREVKTRLVPGGLYVANVIDELDGRFITALSHTISRVFSHVYILPASTASVQGRHGPNLIVASDEEIDWERWKERPGLPFGLKVLPPPDGSLVLTDDYAPVDNLILPIVAQRLRH